MTKNDIGTIILNWLKGFFTKNLALKIVSLLFAMLIWGYVMVEVNPKRVKTITDVPISFSGESSLHDRGLAVRGDRDDILRNVTVRVKVQLTDYTGLDASDISASVSLRPVNKADTYKLKIDATSSLGTVENVSPSEITIEVDELATMLVPIDVEYSGELPEGYWKSEPTLASQSIKVSGPRDDVSTISKAICTINLACLIRKISIERNRVTINHPVVACHGKSQFLFQCGRKNGHVSSEFFAIGTEYSRGKLFGSSDVAFIACFLGNGYTGIILCA